MFRDLSKTELNNFRRRYIKLRYTILSKKYQSPSDQLSLEFSFSGCTNFYTFFLFLSVNRKGLKVSHIRNSSDSSFLSFIYDDLVASCDTPKRASNATLTPDDLLCEDRIPNVTPSIAFCENFSFSGMYHIFDQHKDSVNSIKFANQDNSLICAASTDGTLSICQLTPSPATILFILRGHKGAIFSFDWSQQNDLIVSCSKDATLRLWSTKNGTCLRIFKDPANVPILTSLFHPNNNNLIITGNSFGTLNILNLSTGIYSKNAISACEGQVNCMSFDGEILWVGDVKGYISSFRFSSFETQNSRLVAHSKVMVVAGCAITSLSTLCQNEEVLLLANIACNAVILFKCLRDNSNSIEFIKSFFINHQNPSLMIKSSFCPSSSNNKSICIMTCSEDTCIYFYIFDGTKTQSRCVNKLQGHSAPTLDATFNQDETLLASADNKGNIIIWKRESL